MGHTLDSIAINKLKFYLAGIAGEKTFDEAVELRY
jgi:hypothetical protein